MKLSAPLCSFAVVLLAGCASGPRFMPADRDQAIERTMRIGKALHLADQLAAEGSDAFLERVAHKPDPRIEGYVVLPEERRVVFLGKVGDDVRRFGVIAIAESSRVTLLEEAASERELEMHQALKVARAKFSAPCPRPYNAIVIEDPDRPQWLVYFLAATKDSDEIVIGGHVRAVVTLNQGAANVELTPLSKSCLTQGRGNLPAGAELASLVVTHPLGDIPSEAHVFVSLLENLDVFVLARDQSGWMVERGNIRPMNR